MNRKSLLLLFLLFGVQLFSNRSYAQSEGKIIVVVNKADWCPVCRANGDKVMKEVMPVFNESNTRFVINDLTNENTKKDSKMKLEELDAYPAVKKIEATGLLLLVDEKSGKLLAKISVAEPAEKLIATIKEFSMKEKM